MQSQKT